MTFLVLLVLGIILVPTHSKPKGEYLGTPFLQHSFEEAKKIVDDAYKYSREESLRRVRKNVGSPQEALQFLMQPYGDTRSAVRSADYMALTLRLVHDKVHRVHKRSVNATDLLSEECINKLAEITGCAARVRPPQCNIIPNLNKYRTFTGVCNNLNHPRLGASNTPLARCLPAEYDDYYSSPKGSSHKSQLPLARTVSSCILKTLDADVDNDRKYTQMGSAWGQFVAHEISSTPSSPSIKSFSNGVNCRRSCERTEPCLPILLPPGDRRSGTCISAVRSAPACGTGYSAYNFGGEANKRQQMNRMTVFMDAETIYGSDKKSALSLRNLTNNDGLLNVNMECCDNGRDMLPFSHQRVQICATHGKTEHDPTAPESPCFATGDFRGNQNTAQMVIHTLFMREHNRLARQLKILNPQWDSETLYQEARKIVIAEIQIITYRDYLPLIVGEDAMYTYLGPYPGYDPDVDPSLCNVFATAAFRFGHLAVHPLVCRLDENYKEHLKFPNVQLFKTFFAPWRICYEGGIDPLLRGLIGCPAKLNTQDHMMPETMTEHLFKFVFQKPQDLASANIMRGRDHGLPGYNEWRRYCGLSQPSNEAELGEVLGNAHLAKKLLEFYGTPNNIDVWVGGVAEPSVRGGRVGPLFACLIAKQFQKIRQGDRLWWENKGVFTVKQRYALSSVTLSSIICGNTGIKYVPSNPFKIISSYNRLVRCSRYPQLDLSPWREKTYKGAHCFGSDDEEETNQVDESDCEDAHDLQDHRDTHDLQDHQDFQDFQDPLFVQDNAVH